MTRRTTTATEIAATRDIAIARQRPVIERFRSDFIQPLTGKVFHMLWAHYQPVNEAALIHLGWEVWDYPPAILDPTSKVEISL